MVVSINGGTPSHHVFLDGIFHWKPSSYWGTPIYGNLQIGLFIVEDQSRKRISYVFIRILLEASLVLPSDDVGADLSCSLAAFAAKDT